MKHLKSTFLFIIVAALLSITVFAYSGELSPAIDIIKSKSKFIKSGTTQSDVIFSVSDFDDAFGIKVKSITIRTLPPVKDGILKLDGQAVVSNQEIPRKRIGTLKFVPNAKSVAQTSFIVYHSADSATQLKCTISLAEGINFTPSASEASFSTQRNITLCKSLSAFDPEDDELTYEIVTAPQNGILTLTCNTGGSFNYTPKENFCGNDSFEYRVVDEHGNASEKEKVKIKVIKPLSDIYFTDMVGHWAHNAAIKTAAKGYMPVVYDENGYAVFQPDQVVTREEFLVSAMKAVGYKIDKDIISTVFTDNNYIASEARSYVSAAYRDGIISGYASPTGMVFDPDGKITRAQAAVIVSKLADVPHADSKEVFADAQTIPTWAYDAMSSLVSCGIMNGMGDGTMNASATLTKAQCAELLCSVEEYHNEQKKKNGFLSGLFGKN
ncbi:MAG: hypothetical protein E7588_00025 [Ruminococcaceae bacterium]|nr:hypothetical protein [Oscillospiraceae bacterium]